MAKVMINTVCLIRFCMPFILILCQGTAAMDSAAVVDFCVDSDLNITCPRNHVILMQQAFFGRMRTGGCIKEDKNIGCTVDVLPQMHELCSGRAYCKGRVPYTDFQKKVQCLEEMLAYLAVEFKCVSAVSGSGNQCQQHKPITIQDTDGYITSMTFKGQPSPKPSICIFEIVVPKGQTVSVTYMNFQAEQGSHGQFHCFLYTKEDTRKRPFCEDHVTENAYESMGNRVFIELKHSHSATASAYYFLIKYQAVGCKDPQLPPDMWFEREGPGLSVQCNHTVQKWHLVCSNNAWVGGMENCTGGVSDKDGIVQKQDVFPFSLIIAVLVGIFIGILLGVTLLCTASCVLRRRKNSENYYGTSNISQGPDRSFMLQSKPYPYDHSYECTTTRNPSQLTSQGLMSVTATSGNPSAEECNPNCPYNSMVRGTETRGKCTGRQQPGLRLWQDTPSLIKDSEGELHQSHYWDNKNTTCACPVVDDTGTRLPTQRSTRENSLDNSQDILTPLPSLNHPISILR